MQEPTELSWNSARTECHEGHDVAAFQWQGRDGGCVEAVPCRRIFRLQRGDHCVYHDAVPLCAEFQIKIQVRALVYFQSDTGSGDGSKSGLFRPNRVLSGRQVGQMVVTLIVRNGSTQEARRGLGGLGTYTWDGLARLVPTTA